MISFGIVVIAIHIMQAIWFCIAFKKRLELENLDKKAALSYLKNRMTINNSLILSQKDSRLSESKFQSSQQNQCIYASIASTPLLENFTHVTSIKKEDNVETSSSPLPLPPPQSQKQVIIKKSSTPPKIGKTLQITSSNTNNSNNNSSNWMISKTIQGTVHLKPGHLERSRNLESSIDLEDNSVHNSSHASLNSLKMTTAISRNIEDATKILNDCDSRKTSGFLSSSSGKGVENNLSYQYIPLLQQSSRDS